MQHEKKSLKVHLVAAVGGETFETCNERVGVVVSLENKQAKVSVWTNLVWVCSCVNIIHCAQHSNHSKSVVYLMLSRPQILQIGSCHMAVQVACTCYMLHDE